MGPYSLQNRALDAAAGLGAGAFCQDDDGALQGAVSRRLGQEYLAVQLARPEPARLLCVVDSGEETVRYKTHYGKLAEARSGEGLMEDYGQAANGNRRKFSEAS